MPLSKKKIYLQKINLFKKNEMNKISKNMHHMRCNTTKKTNV